MKVRQMGPEDWRVMRDLRLAALLDSPFAFTATYEQASQRDDEGWQAWLSGDATLFAAWSDVDEPVGMAGTVPADVAGLAYLFGMWVAPTARRTGVAGALIEAVGDWARSRGLTGILLEVTAVNDVAARAYRRYGFQASADPTSTVDGTSMRLTLV